MQLFALDFGASDSGRDIGYEIRQRIAPSLAVAVPTFLLGVLATVCVALLMVFFRATYLDFWGVTAAVVLMSIDRSALDRSQMLLGDVAEHPRPSPETVRVQFTTHPQLVFSVDLRRQRLRFGRRQGRHCVDLRTLPAVLLNGRPQCIDGFAGRGAEGLDLYLAHPRRKAACPCKHPELRRAGDAEQPVTLDRHSRGAG